MREQPDGMDTVLPQVSGFGTRAFSGAAEIREKVGHKPPGRDGTQHCAPVSPDQGVHNSACFGVAARFRKCPQSIAHRR